MDEALQEARQVSNNVPHDVVIPYAAIAPVLQIGRLRLKGEGHFAQGKEDGITLDVTDIRSRSVKTLYPLHSAHPRYPVGHRRSDQMKHADGNAPLFLHPTESQP